jgi:hypothetical protein
VYQVSNDGEGWGTSADPVGGGTTNIEGSDVLGNRLTTSPWVDVTATMLRAFRVGVLVTQNSADKLEMARVSLILDALLKS